MHMYMFCTVVVRCTVGAGLCTLRTYPSEQNVHKRIYFVCKKVPIKSHACVDSEMFTKVRISLKLINKTVRIEISSFINNGFRLEISSNMSNGVRFESSKVVTALESKSVATLVTTLESKLVT